MINSTKERPFIPLSYDLVFKRVFADEYDKRPLKTLLNVILNIDISTNDITILNSEMVGKNVNTKKNYRRGEEHGSAKWGNIKEINSKYMQQPFTNNKIFTKNTCMGLNAKQHRRNLNTLIIGGSGAGKTRFYAKIRGCHEMK